MRLSIMTQKCEQTKNPDIGIQITFHNLII